MNHEFNWCALRSWENRREAEGLGDPECESFPDHDCPECHSYHVETRYFNEACSICIEQKCETCKGTGYIIDGDTDCPDCKATGRIKT